MPGSILAPVAVDTLPFSLSTKFSEARSLDHDSNMYHDGSCQRNAIVASGRRRWVIGKRLAIQNLQTLRDFWLNHRAVPFFFYNPHETVPPFSHTPAGTSGRYIVRFNTDWEETAGMVRSDASLELIELASGDEINDAPGVILSTSNIATASLGVTTSFTVTNTTGATGDIATIHVGDGSSFAGGVSEFFSSSSNFSLQSQSLSLSADELQTVITAGSYAVAIWIDNPIGGFQPPGSTLATALIHDVHLDVTYRDGSVGTFRPRSASLNTSQANGQSWGGVTNVGNAFDSDPTSSATLLRNSFDSLDFFEVLVLQFAGIQ